MKTTIYVKGAQGELIDINTLPEEKRKEIVVDCLTRGLDTCMRAEGYERVSSKEDRKGA